MNILSTTKIKYPFQKFDIRALPFYLIFSYMLSFVFEGKSFYALSKFFNIDPSGYVFCALFAHLLGLISCGFLVKSGKQLKKVMLLCTSTTMLTAIIFYFPIFNIWFIGISLISFNCGILVSLFGYYIKYKVKNEDIKFACVDVLLWSNVLMLSINIVSKYINPTVANTLGIIFLLISFIIVAGTNNYLNVQETSDNEPSEPKVSTTYYTKVLLVLFVFISAITITGGLMYSFVMPSFGKLSGIVDWYWILPYIIVIVIIRSVEFNVKSPLLLYAGIGMGALSFVFFLLEHNIVNFFIVNALMLGSFAIMDFFWWIISAELINYTQNPARTLGIALSANVLGVSIGSYIGKTLLLSASPGPNVVITALVSACTALFILPLLNSLMLKTSKIITNENQFSTNTLGESNSSIKFFPTEPQTFFEQQTPSLTQREGEVLELLLQGKTNKLISNELFVSENTVKTHVKNIYAKFNVTSRAQLIKVYMEASSNQFKSQ